MDKKEVSGAILAGGRGMRLGGEDKGLVKLAGRPMIAHVIERLAPQVNSIVINANRNIKAYEQFSFPVVQDSIPDFAGPLSGMATVLAQCRTPYLATAPCDAPFLPDDFVARVLNEINQATADVGVAIGAGRPQPAFAIISVKLLGTITDFLESGGRKISTWYRQQKHVEVNFGMDEVQFANVNSQEDLLSARNRLGLS